MPISTVFVAAQPDSYRTRHSRTMHLRLVSSLVCFIILSIGTNRAVIPAVAYTPPVTVTPDLAAIDRYVQVELDAIGTPGAALAIVHGDQIVHLRGFGVADPSGRAVTPQTPFNTASMSKSITALAIMQLVEAGIIELAAPVQRYLPWFQVADPQASARITVQDLLNHTSGLSTAVGNDYPHKDDRSDTALEQRVRTLNTAVLNHPVGSTWEYSNANYDTLGLIVQVVSGQPYESYIQQHIFAPLEMHTSFPSRREAQEHRAATGYRQWFGIPFSFTEVAPRAHLPSGHQFNSAEDLAHLLIAYLNEGRYRERSVLSAAGIHAMQHTPVTSGRGCATYSMHWGHATDCDLPRLGFGGDDVNFKARALIDTVAKWGVVLLMNAQAISFNGPRQDRIEDGVLDLLHGLQPVVATPHNMQSVIVISLIAGVVVIQVAHMLRSRVVLRRWRMHAERRPKGWIRIVWRVAVPVVLNLLWLAFLGYVVQVGTLFSTRPLHFILENTPDMGWRIVISGALARGWGIVRTILAVQVLRTDRTQRSIHLNEARLTS